MQFCWNFTRREIYLSILYIGNQVKLEAVYEEPDGVQQYRSKIDKPDIHLEECPAYVGKDDIKLEDCPAYGHIQ